MAHSAELKKERRKTKASDDNRVVTRRGGGGDDSYHSKNHIEDNLAVAIDNKNTLLKLQRQLERLQKTADVKGFIEDIAPDTVVQLAMIAHDANTSEKVRLAAIQDILDRAGYNKVTKTAVARIDASESKEAIIASIYGAKKELKAVGLEITDEDEDQSQGSGETLEG
jgi:hypothetical protein